jgi:hypothetical protein
LRRVRTNLAHQEEIRTFTADHGIAMEIKNAGQHWVLVKNENRLEWWPSSAKLIENQTWNEGVHVHDWTQLINEARRFFLSPPNDPEPVEHGPQSQSRREEAVRPADEDAITAFAARNGLKLEIHNHGQHWVLSRGSADRLEWWPSTGTLLWRKHERPPATTRSDRLIHHARHLFRAWE